MDKIEQSPFQKYEKFKRDYSDRYYYLLIIKRKAGDRLIGQNSVRFLLLALQRSRYLSESLSMCLRHKHQGAAFLSVRAHFEVTGMIAYFYKKIQQFYTGEITYEEFDATLRCLTLGGRTFPDKQNLEERNIPKSINVLTFIDEADRLFNSMAKENVNHFRYCYDFLSEFCHPNYLGLSIGNDVINWNACAFSKNQTFDKNQQKHLVRHLNISSILLFPIYDKCFAIIKERESKDMPILLKSRASARWIIFKHRLGIKEKAFENLDYEK